MVAFDLTHDAIGVVFREDGCSVIRDFERGGKVQGTDVIWPLETAVADWQDLLEVDSRCRTTGGGAQRAGRSGEKPAKARTRPASRS